MACAYALVITLAVAGFSGFFGPAPAAVAKGPAISGSGATYYFAAAWNSNVSAASVTYGRASDQLLVGDWNGDGLDSLAIYRDGVIRGRNALGPGPEDVTLTIGRPGDTIIVGDWNGDGIDTVGLRRGTSYFIANSHSNAVSSSVNLGRSYDQSLVADWNNDGKDTIALRQGNVVYTQGRDLHVARPDRDRKRDYRE